MNSTSKIIVAAAAGAVVGAALGILFAPEKGSELRKKIAEKGKKLAGEVKHEFENRAHEWKEKVKEMV